MNKEKTRLEIQLLSENYNKSKAILKKVEKGYTVYDIRRINTHRNIVSHIESTVESLSDKDRLIIEKEVIEGLKGEWFLGYFSKPSYYRNRQKAYERFLNCL